MADAAPASLATGNKVEGSGEIDALILFYSGGAATLFGFHDVLPGWDVTLQDPGRFQRSTAGRQTVVHPPSPTERIPVVQ